MLDRLSPLVVRPLSWAAVNTHPHQERIALDNLKRQGFETYCPMVHRRVRHARRTQDVLRPLFPGYLFAAVEPMVQPWRPMLSTVGVRTVVRFGDELSLLDDSFIRGLKAQEVNGVVRPPTADFKVGDKVSVAAGALEGLAATVVALSEKDRVTVLLNILSRPVNVQLGADLLRKA